MDMASERRHVWLFCAESSELIALELTLSTQFEFGQCHFTVGVLIQATKSVNSLNVCCCRTGYPQCALYNGQGGPEDHEGLAAPPFLEGLPQPPPKSWIPVFRQTLPG